MDATIKKVAYYAHPMSHYDTDFEWECIDLIYHMLTPLDALDGSFSREDPKNNPFSVFNPNQTIVQNMYDQRRKADEENAFDIFDELVLACDYTVGCTFFDGAIGAGVGREMRVAMEAGKEVFMISISNNKQSFFQCNRLYVSKHKTLSREETRERINRGEM